MNIPSQYKQDVGKKKHDATPVSLNGDTRGFMNTIMEVGSNPTVGIPQPPTWANYEDHDQEGKVTITETIAFNKEERPAVSPLDILLCQSKLNRQPKSNIKRMIKRQAVLNSVATNTFMRPQSG